MLLLKLIALGQVFSQENEPKQGLLFGYNFFPQNGNSYAEIAWIPYTFDYGSYYSHALPGPFTTAYTAPNIGLELKTSTDNFILGSKIGVSANKYFIATGLHAIHYTDFKNSDFRLRPEIGLNLMATRFVYGYSFPLGSTKLEHVNSHNFAITYFLKLDF